MRKQFRVSLGISQIHEYDVEANSPEEAITIAEQFFEEGEEGAVTTVDFFSNDAVPINEMEAAA